MSVEGNALVEDLTKREYDVLELMIQAHSNREISERLNVSIETVRTHTKRIYAKLNVSGRQEASFRAIQLGLVDDPHTPIATKHTNLQTTYDVFMGRKKDLSALATLFERGERLVSIVGVGGMGKTRLAIEFAMQQLKHYQHGSYVVELESVQDKQAIILQIADSLPIKLTGNNSPLKQILDYLADKHLLLVIDNCEHVITALDFLVDILDSAPNVQLIATSRIRLHLSREAVYNLRGLSIPQNDRLEESNTSDAIDLLVRFAQRVKPDWAITDKNWHSIYELCRVTQGMPLAILLAVGWLDVYPLERIVEEIRRNVDFLETDLRDVPDRHRSMRAVFDWTWRLLTDAERDVLMKFSVFSNGCMLDAVEKITGATPAILKSLISKALIQRDTTGRYRTHPLQRQYNAEKLEMSSNVAHNIFNAHAEYYVTIAEDIMTNKYYGEMVKADLDNLYSAWYWLVDVQNIELLWRCVNTYGIIAYQLGNLRETKALYVYAIEQLDETRYPKLFGSLVYVCASLHDYVQDRKNAKTYLQQAQSLLKSSPIENLQMIYTSYHGALTTRYLDYADALEQVHLVVQQLESYNLADNRIGQTMLGYAYTQLAFIYTNVLEDYPLAETYVEKALHIVEPLEHHFLIAFANQHAGEIRLHQGEYEDAQYHFQTAESAYAKIVKTFDYGTMQFNAAKVELALGHEAEARIYLQHALALYYEYRFLQGTITLMLVVIPLVVNSEDMGLAIEMLGFCMEHTHYPRQQSIIQKLDDNLRLLVDKVFYAQALQSGRLLTYEMIVLDLMVWLED